MKRGQVSKRITWNDTVPFPGNHIFRGRLTQIRRRWGGYRHELINTPVIFDNTAGAFSEYPPETLFVGDGCHRRELASEDGALGEEFIAELHRGLTRSEMFARREASGDRRTVRPGENFLSRVERFPNGIERKIKEDVEGLGWHICVDRENHGIRFTNELTWIWRQNRGAMLRAIETYEAAFGTNTHDNQGGVLKAFGAFWLKYPDADFDRLVSSLKSVTADDLYQSGKVQRETATFLGRSQLAGMTYSLMMGYNRNLGARSENRLDWGTGTRGLKPSRGRHSP